MTDSSDNPEGTQAADGKAMASSLIDDGSSGDSAGDSGSGPAAASSAEFEPIPGEARVGEVLAGRYELVELLGSGAMGDVYKAEHALMRKTVAIKVLNAEVSGQGKIVERFRREAQAAANIDHPNVCVATDFGRTERGDFFLVMEYLEGRTLKQLVAESGGFDIQRSLHIADQICSALIRAHEVGVVHRDLKPDNIMLVERGGDPDFVKILDFGIARVRMTDEMPDLTKTGAVFGTPSYMSPEQAAGDPVDHRTDLYSIGNVLFEMLTGRRVFRASRGAKVMAMHVSKAPPVPSEYVSGDLDPELNDLVLQLLEKDPKDRPQTAKELRRRLHGIAPELIVDIEPGLPVEQNAFRDSDSDDSASASLSRQVVNIDDEPSLRVVQWAQRTTEWLQDHGPMARWSLVGGVGTAIVALAGLAIVAATSGGAQRTQAAERKASEPLSVERSRFLNRTEIRPLREELEQGASHFVVERLEAAREKSKQENPHRAFMLARAYASIDQWPQALAESERVLRLEPDYINSEAFGELLVTILENASGDALKRVRELIGDDIDVETVRRVVGRAAWRGRTSRIRRRAKSLLEETDTLAKLPEWVSSSIAVRHSRGCKEHAENIEKLVESGDRRGLEILHIYDGFSRSGCGRNDKEDCFGCIRDDIDEAIETLRVGDGPDKPVEAGGEE